MHPLDIPIKNELIELTNSVILGRQDNMLEEELIWKISMIYSRINGIDGVVRELHILGQLY